MQKVTPVILNLLIINVLVFLAQSVFSDGTGIDLVTDTFALHHYKSEYFKPHQLITHLFMHGGFRHILFNMFGLWMFGSSIENYLGTKKFLLFYFICGIAAGLTQLGFYAATFWQIDHALISPELYKQYQEILRLNVTVGASGAIMGVFVAFGYLFPNTEMMIMPIPVPVKAKWLIVVMVAADLFGGFARAATDNVAHFAHLGGAAAGFLLIFLWNKNRRKTFY